jgi:hypothetical protein
MPEVGAMITTQEFLVLGAESEIAVYAPRQFPSGTPIGPDARRLGITGPSAVRPPKVRWTPAEFDAWRRSLEGLGYSVTIGPFWRDPVSPEQAEEAVRLGQTAALKDAFDELLREAERRDDTEDQPMEAVEPRHS